jgi:hypothetical protein
MKIFNKYYLLILMLSGLVSCKKDKFQDSSALTFNKEASFVVPTALVKECVGTLDIPLKFKSGNQITNQYFEVSVVGGTAVEGEDFELVTTEFEIPAFRDSNVVTLNIIADDSLETDETVVLRVKQAANSSNLADQDSIDITVTIVNSGTSVIGVNFAWEDTITLGETTYNTCDEVDMDIYLFDESGADLGIYAAATANCPEGFNLDMSGPAFTFYFSASLYYNGLFGVDEASTRSIPITTTIERQAGGLTSFVQSSTSAFNVNSLDYEVGGSEEFVDLAKVEFDGSCTVLIYNSDTGENVSLRKKAVKNNYIHKK